jgi:TRAP transporter 4TM/12TM fusion protein
MKPEPIGSTIAGRAEVGANQRPLRGWESRLVFWIAVGFTSFHIVVLNLYPIDPWLFRSFHVSVGSVIGFCIFSARNVENRPTVPWYDWLAVLISLCGFFYIYSNLEDLLFRTGVAPTFWDTIVAGLSILLILELTRRSAGLALPIIASLFIVYCFVGPWMPGVLQHRGFPFDNALTFVYSMDGIFGLTTGISSTYLILFITFGAFLQASKAGEYFIQFALAVAGKARGGPAKVAVISSALMGTINGSAVGNVATTGTFTIPLMKRLGYPSRTAGAIEAVASTGGMIMPPVMGAGAFVMAEVTGIAYGDIAVAAAIPAVVYFLAVYFMVDGEARRRGMRGLAKHELPEWNTVMRYTYQFIPLFVLIGALVTGYSVIRSGTLGIASAFVVSLLRPETRIGIPKILEALHLGAKGTIQLMAVLACAGIIVGVIGLTGIGLRFSSMLIAVAGDSQFFALIFAMLISLVLGLGMPATAAYAVAASVVAPGLIQLGIHPLVAHMFIFYYSVISAITPPVALAAYAGAAIAGSGPMRTSVVAFKYGLAAFIVPFNFFYSPALLMQGETLVIVHVAITACIGVYLLACALQGWFLGRAAGMSVRAGLLIASLLLIEGQVITDVIGIVLAVGMFVLQRSLSARSQDVNAGKNMVILTDC